MIRLLRRQITK